MVYTRKQQWFVLIAFRLIVGALLVCLLLSSAPFTLLYAQQDELVVPYGVASGDVTDHSAIVWSRANKESLMQVQYDNDSNFSSAIQHSQTQIVNKSTDYAGHIKLNNLTSNTVYYYRIQFSDLANPSIKSEMVTGKFKTAPDRSDSTQNVTFVIAGDLGGSRLCRHIDTGYPILSIVKTLSPDFFIFNGDQIYADNNCPQAPSQFVLKHFPGWKNVKGDFPSVTDRSVVWNNSDQLHQVYLKHWEYNRADIHLQNLLNNTSMYSQADDHEVINDYGGQWAYDYIDPDNSHREGYPKLVKNGINLFFEFSPIDRNQTDANRIYRSFNWGKNLDLFLLDAHSYRSQNNLPDAIQNNKTLYGKQQLEWLKNGIMNSNATWKVISNTVPITIPNCFEDQKGCDNWATSGDTNNTFVRERNAFLKFLDEHNIKNIVFIATDVHFAGTVKVNQDFDGDGDNLTFYEMVNGPLSTFTQNSTNPVDPTINANYLYNESAIFNFGYLKIQQDKQDHVAHLLYEVVDSNNRFRPGSQLDLVPK
jgi:alkaline phosphatase D